MKIIKTKEEADFIFNVINAEVKGPSKEALEAIEKYKKEVKKRF